MKQLLVLLLLSASTASAAEWRLLEPSAAIIRAENYETLRDPYLRQYDSEWTYGVAMGLDIDLLSYKRYRLYYDPILKFRATESQIRQGGLEYQTGFFMPVRKGMSVNVFRYHESLHALEANADTPDGKSTSRHYPLIDSYGIELKWRLK